MFGFRFQTAGTGPNGRVWFVVTASGTVYQCNERGGCREANNR